MPANRATLRPRKTPVLAAVISLLWVVIGLILRSRFGDIRCASSEGGWELAAYLLLTVPVALWISPPDPDALFGDRAHRVGPDRAYRVMRRLVGLVALAILVSACISYATAHEGCSSQGCRPVRVIPMT